MKIFITGASGFVGSAATKMLLKEGHTVIAMSRSVSSDEAILKLGAIPVRCELNQVTVGPLEGCDVVIHAAAKVESWGKASDFEAINIQGTKQLLDAAKAAGVKRFLHISTEAVLWTGKNIIEADETYPYSTGKQFLYGYTKREAEKAVLAANIPGVFETIALRPRMVWGPEDKTILPAAIEMYKKGNFIWINEGRAKTSTTHIFNLTEALRLALTKGKGGEAYFITDNEITTLNNLFTALFATQGLSIKAGSMKSWIVKAIAALLETIWRTFNITSPPPVTRTAACIMSCECTIKNNKAKMELDYEPVISLEEGLKQLASFKLNG